MEIKDFQEKPDLPLESFRFMKKYVLTEDNSDLVIGKLGEYLDSTWISKIPFAKKIILSTLDRMFPEKAIELLGHVMVSSGLMTENDLLHVDSPFR